MFFVIAVFSNSSYAIDIVKTKHPGTFDKKAEHRIELIKRALEITEPEYGPFRIDKYTQETSVGRSLKALVDRKLINTMIMPANDLWDSYSIPIKVPVRLGLLSYRVLLVNKDHLPAFEDTTSLQELNKLTAGLISGWATTKAFKFNRMKLVGVDHFDGLFLMLKKHRFDYIPRGINEVDDELRSRKSSLDGLVVEPSIALYIPTSTNFYIAKSEPRLAKRLETGLKIMLNSGELKDILYKYFAEHIERANIAGRKVFKIENPYHNQNNKADEKYYIFSAMDQKLINTSKLQ